MSYEEIEKKILTILEKTPTCVFATANKKGEVSTAQMSLVSDGLTVYVQTDKTFEKVKNIKENPYVSVNCGAYNFKGIATIVGHPKNHQVFVEKIKQRHLSTYNLYTNLPNEVLIEVRLTEARIWEKDSTTNQETIKVVNLETKTYKTIICDSF